MLMRLLRQYLKPYRSMIVATILPATLGTMGALYLPSLNASIIDEGVAKGDTDFIWHTGMIMLAVSAVRSSARSARSTSAPRPPWPSAGICAARSSIAS